MHATCEFNNVANTATTTTTTTAAATACNVAATVPPLNLHQTQDQILIHSFDCNSSNSSHNHHLVNGGNTDKNGHATRSCSNDDLFMSASSSTTDFCGKTVNSATPTNTVHVLSQVNEVLSATPTSSPSKTKPSVRTAATQQQQMLSKRDISCPSSKTVTPTVSPKSTPIKFPKTDSVGVGVIADATIASTPSINSCSDFCSSTPSILNNNNSSSISTQAPNSFVDNVSATAIKETTTLQPAEHSAALPKANASSPLLERVEFEDLLQWKDMPTHLQFNPYVLTGYRPLSSVKGCLSSLFYWHNETINILTHGIPIVYILATVPSIMPWENDFRFLSFCHIFGAVAPWCGSFIYHLFMNLERGESIYYRLLKIDMVGIWISQSFGALPMVTASVYCFGDKTRWLMIIGYCILSLWGLYKALNASSPWQRRLCFALPFTMRVFLTFFRTIRWVGGNPEALTHVYLQDLVSVFGGAIGAMHIPEKWFPGRVDLYLNSHNIMHVLVVAAVVSMHKATVSDFVWMSKIECSDFYNSSATIENSMNEHLEL